MLSIIQLLLLFLPHQYCNMFSATSPQITLVLSDRDRGYNTDQTSNT